jgi:hypothetical protein
MPKKKLPDQVVHFKIKSRAKAKGERSYPTRTIAVDVQTDLYTLAEVIVQAFDFDFDHAFGFFDNLNNPYDSQARFELFSDADMEQPLPDFLPQDLPMLAAFGLEGADRKDILQVIKVLQKVNPAQVQIEMAEEITNLILERIKQKLQGQLPERLMPIADTLLKNTLEQARAQENLNAPIELGVKGVSWQTAFLPQRPKMLFLFDYGDDWMFEVECLGISTPDPKQKYPAFLESKGKSPEQYPDWD